MEEKKINRIVWLFIIASALVRSILAASLDFGNDEVYYYTYALFPAWSHFDHPPMVGWVIRLFTFNTLLNSVYFIRLASIILGSASTFLAYKITRLYGSPRSGLLAVVMMTASIYASVIAGIFILPDTPQIFFWLLALYCFSLSFASDNLEKRASLNFILGGIFTGMAILSKYTSAFIWLGVILFIVLYRRHWLRNKIVYLSLFLTFLIQIPVIIWNFQNQFISFTYQGNRVAGLSSMRLDYFITEFVGEFFYNNPLNFIIIAFSLYLVFFTKKVKINPGLSLVLLTSLPLIGTFWFLSVFHSTLPHWTGPAFTSLIVFTAVVLDKYYNNRKQQLPMIFRASLILALSFVILGYLQVTSGIITRIVVPSDKKSEEISWDISLDMYGWKQLKKAMPQIYKRDLALGDIKPNPFLISWRWFPAANLDYYVAMPMGLKLFAFGKLEQIHKYYWINKLRGPIPYGDDAYFICTSRDKKNPGMLFRDQFKQYSRPDTVPVYRGGRQVMEFYVYRLKTYQREHLPFKSFFLGRPIL